MMKIYPNNLKNREFGKTGARSLIQQSDAEAAQLQQVGRCRRDQNLGCPAQPKTDSSSCLGIVFLCLIRFYQLCLSPFVGTCCRFFPSCSEYALEAIKVHGALKGAWLSLKRIAKCGPWHPGGCDCVPLRKNTKNGSNNKFG